MSVYSYVIISRIEDGRMSDFLAQQQKYSEQFASAPGSPTYTCDLIEAGGMSFQEAVTRLEFASAADFGAFQDSFSPADLAAIYDGGAGGDAPAELLRGLVTTRLVG